MKGTDYSSIANQYGAHRCVNPKVVELLAATLHCGSRVLEVGCGTGHYLAEMCALKGADGTGVDPSPEMLSARAQHVSATLIVGRAEQLNVPADQFDLVYSVDVIHHVADRAAAYREAFRVLREGGRVCTVTESEVMLRTREPQSRCFPETIDVELTRYPSIQSLWSEMRRAGFQDLSENVTEWTYELTDAAPFREKVFSSLLCISESAFQSGLASLEADLVRGAVPYVSRYVLLWGIKRPAA